jgi:hypothetical protein
MGRSHMIFALLLSDRNEIASQETEAIASMKIHYIIRVNGRQFMNSAYHIADFEVTAALHDWTLE